MKLLTKIILGILALSAIPIISYATVTVPMVATSTDQGFITPNPVNGKIDAIKAPYFVASSTTASQLPYASSTQITATDSFIQTNGATTNIFNGSFWEQGGNVAYGTLAPNANTAFLISNPNFFAISAPFSYVKIQPSTLSISPAYGFNSGIRDNGFNNGDSVYGMYSIPYMDSFISSGNTNVYAYYGRPDGVVEVGGTVTKYGMYMTNEDENYFSNKIGIGSTTPFTSLSIGTGANTINLLESATSTFSHTVRSNCFSTDGVTCLISGSAGSAYPFTTLTNYGVLNSATNTPIWAQAGLNASSTSNLVYASTTALSGNLFPSLGQGWLNVSGATGAIQSSTSPTVNYITSTSTTKINNFYGNLTVGRTVALPATTDLFGNLGINTSSIPGVVAIYATTSVPTPTGASAVINYNAGGDYTANGSCYEYEVYAYKTIAGTKYYSSGNSDTGLVCDDNSSNSVDLSVSWNASSGVDGYKVLIRNDFLGYNFDMSYVLPGTSFTDGDGTEASYTADVTVTPSASGVVQGNLGLSISSNGYVGVNTLTPTVPLSVKGYDAGTTISFGLYDSNGNREFSVDNSGDVAITSYNPASGGSLTLSNVNVPSNNTPTIFEQSLNENSGYFGVRDSSTAGCGTSGSNNGVFNYTVVNTNNSAEYYSPWAFYTGGTSFPTNRPIMGPRAPASCIVEGIGYTAAGTTGGVTYWTNNIERMRILGNTGVTAGNIGIGTTSPWAQLSVGKSNQTAQEPLFAVASSSLNVATSTTFVVSWKGNVGVGTTTPYANLSIQSNASTGDMFVAATTTGGGGFGEDNDGHQFTTGPAPVISSCGTGTGTVVGDDQGGTITTATAATACTATFAKAYRNTPVCTVTDNSLVGFADISSVSTTAVTFGISSALTGGLLYYQCSYHK